LEDEIMGRCEYEGRWNEEACAFEYPCGWIFGRLLLFGLYPSDVVVGGSTNLLSTHSNSAISLFMDGFIAKGKEGRGSIEHLCSDLMLH
jgi:hypothetical protein